MLKAVLIKGNPKYIKTDLANQFYNQIIEFIEQLGVQVTTDPGADYTCPPKADFYVAHSRGCGRSLCFEGKPEMANFLMFGDPAGIMHPKDREWEEAGRPGIPPDAHFVFTAEMQGAIESKVQELLKLRQPTPVVKSRQSASNRPGVK